MVQSVVQPENTDIRLIKLMKNKENVTKSKGSPKSVRSKRNLLTKYFMPELDRLTLHFNILQ